MSLKEYVVTMSITGRCTVLVRADSEQDALARANEFDIEEGTDELVEWEFDEALSAEQNK